jgi:hypothetical protein
MVGGGGDGPWSVPRRDSSPAVAFFAAAATAVALRASLLLVSALLARHALVDALVVCVDMRELTGYASHCTLLLSTIQTFDFVQFFYTICMKAAPGPRTEIVLHLWHHQGIASC